MSTEVNSSIRESVLVSGTLTSAAMLSACVVRAIKVTLPNLETSEYVKVEVALASPYLPNGDYELHFDGRMMKIRKNSEAWFSEDARGCGSN